MVEESVEKPIQAVVFERAKNLTRTYQLQYQSAEHSGTLPSRTQRESTKTARVECLLSVSWKLRFSRSFIGVENMLARKN